MSQTLKVGRWNAESSIQSEITSVTGCLDNLVDTLCRNGIHPKFCHKQTPCSVPTEEL